LHERQITPLITGGTCYYIESMLWDGFIGQKWTNEADDDNNNDNNDNDDDDDNINNDERAKRLKAASSLQSSAKELYERLQRVDPIMAAKLHHSAIRKVLLLLLLRNSYFFKTFSQCISKG
jgi:tRNA A37 N6-isopentenylltransferase MiaA